MFRTKAVFVVGAGASCELGFPSGQKLLVDIASTLDIRFGRVEMQHGDGRIYATLQELVRSPDGLQGDPNPFLHAASQISDAAHLGLSIDNVINQLHGDPFIPICGKISIARQSLLAEQNSVLKIRRAHLHLISRIWPRAE